MSVSTESMPTAARCAPGHHGDEVRFSVVIPVLNARGYLHSCLDSLLKAAARHSRVDVVIVDNGSTDGSYELLISEYAHTAMILQLKNANVGKIRNFGAAATSSQYLTFIDADCVVNEDYFLEAETVLKNVDCAATGCTYQLPGESQWIEETWHKLHDRQEDGYVPYINAGNLIIRREIFEAVGGFDDELISGEDAHLGQKLLSSGYRLYETKRVAAVHLGNPKSMSQFLRREIWHGLGALGTFTASKFDKPLWMTLLHAVLVGTGTIGFAVLPVSWPVRIATLALCCLISPTLAVAYRIRQRRVVYRPLRSILLYFLYFSGRACALLLLAGGYMFGRRINKLQKRR
jgi:glycosyltransferase involved in cell wall biosynthesis